jgi:hypothetical protein
MYLINAELRGRESSLLRFFLTAVWSADSPFSQDQPFFTWRRRVLLHPPLSRSGS